eukprot:TRINITY_DN25171_c0_g1_i1.p1 TRINITY_DN25171_c0_g1~~TRINITY_DN25171_c0_g1_i1.p1  ORF type:complete len:943 (-),score=195.17 TRINITY_DN25171_c0_g1_i1:266-3094(-)
MAASKVWAVAAAVFLKANGAHASEAEDCPDPTAPYSDEGNPFGWPLVPSDWSFHYPHCWEKNYVMCAGERQSPMDIDVGDGVRGGGEGPGALRKASKYGKVGAANGATAPEVRVSKYMRTAYVEGDFGTLTLKSYGNEKVVFDATSVHLTTSSLHTVGGQHYDGEIMVLHKPAAKDGMSSTLTHEGVMVSAFYTVSDTESSELFTQMGFGTDPNVIPSEATPFWAAPGLDGDRMIDLEKEMEPALAGSSWFYNGSIPVPPCSETIKWFVLQEPLKVHRTQLDHLKTMLQMWAGSASSFNGHNKRPPLERNRPIVKNTLRVGGSHEFVTCKAFSDDQKAKHAACWQELNPQCSPEGRSQSPLVLSKGNHVSHKETASAGSFLNYKVPKNSEEALLIKPSLYTLDMKPKGNMDTEENVLGNMEIHGTIFPVRAVSVKVMSQHVIGGQRYPAELVIEHSMFGDRITDTNLYPDYDPMHHVVMLSVPIKLGGENPLLRQMGLGASVFESTIRDGLSYSPLEDVDLMSAFKASTGPGADWFWYNGSMTQPPCKESVKWLVLTKPIEASMEQLNYLALAVSGFDSTRLPIWERPRSVDPNHYLNHLPPHAVQINKDCPAPSEGWSYLNVHCWDKCELGCHPQCMTGKQQSPINLDTTDIPKERKNNFLHICRWKPVSLLHVANNGNSLMIANQQMGYIEQINSEGHSEFYQLAQVQLHMPSEHLVDGKQFHAELQITHARQVSVEELDKNDLLVVSIMLDIGVHENALLNQLLFPAGPGGPPQVHEYKVSDYPVDLMRALGPVLDGNFYTYNGSLTTPPCTEGVKWFVFETPQSISTLQWLYFKKYFANPANNRPLQETNGRRLSKNSFDMVDETNEAADYDFWVLKDDGRNRRNPGAAWIVLPVFLTALLCCIVMAASFVREETRKRKEGAGLAETIGSASAYAPIN